MKNLLLGLLLLTTVVAGVGGFYLGKQGSESHPTVYLRYFDYSNGVDVRPPAIMLCGNPNTRKGYFVKEDVLVFATCY